MGITFASFYGNGPVTPVGCVCFANSDPAVGQALPVPMPVNGGSLQNSVEGCTDAHQAAGYTYAGVELEVGTNSCTCFTSLFDIY